MIAGPSPPNTTILGRTGSPRIKGLASATGTISKSAQMSFDATASGMKPSRPYRRHCCHQSDEPQLRRSTLAAMSGMSLTL
jgi:hypothetical protein